MLSVYLQMLDTEEEKVLFEELYLQYKDLMFNIANNILNNAYDAEDVVHQSFLTIAKHIAGIDAVNSPRTKSFIIIITKNKALDCLRYRKRFADENIEDNLFYNTQFPGDNLLAGAIAKLPERTKHILLLHYDNGFSTQEIAQMLNMNRNTVQKTILRAREKIKQLITEENK